MPNVPVLTMNDGQSIPQLGVGLFRVDPAEAERMVSDALATGYRHIDTATSYANEEGVGRAIARSGIARDELFVTTKLWNADHADAKAAIRASLHKLCLDYLDLYLVHWPAPVHDRYLEAWLAIEEAQREGLVRSIGVSNFHEHHLDRILEGGTVVPAVNQIELHPSFTQEELVAINARHNIRTEAWSPLGQGQDLALEAIMALALELGRTPAQVILRWHLQKGYIAFPKSLSAARLAENLKALEFELTPDQLLTIDQLDRGNRVGSHPDQLNRLEL